MRRPHLLLLGFASPWLLGTLAIQACSGSGGTDCSAAFTLAFADGETVSMDGCTEVEAQADVEFDPDAAPAIRTVALTFNGGDSSALDCDVVVEVSGVCGPGRYEVGPASTVTWETGDCEGVSDGNEESFRASSGEVTFSQVSTQGDVGLAEADSLESTLAGSVAVATSGGAELIGNFSLTTTVETEDTAEVLCRNSEDDGEADADADTDSDTDTDTDCDIEIRETWPSSGSTDAFYRNPLEVQFNKPHDGSASISVDGVSGTSDFNDDRTLLTFDHDGLQPKTDYQAQVTYCRGTATWDFTTSELGEPLTTSLVGKVYSANVGSGRIVEPPGVGAALSPYLEDELLIEVLQVQGTVIRGLGAATDPDSPGTQDMCAPTFELPIGDFSASPYLEAGPAGELTIGFAGEPVTLEDVETSGAFAADGSFFGGGTAQGTIDTRPLVPLIFDDEDDPSALCDFMRGFGVSCVACSDGTGDYCLAMHVVDMVLDQVATDLESIALENCHEDCPDTWQNDGSLTNPDCTL